MRCAWLIFLLCGCGLTSAVRDAGQHATGGGAGGGAAGGTGGGTAMGSMTYLLAPIDDPSDAGRVMAISGPSNDLFAVGNNGPLFHSTDGIHFTRVAKLGNRLLAVWVAADGAVFVSSGSSLGVCKTPPCTSAGAFTWATPTGTDLDTDFLALCGDARSNVFAVGTRSTLASEGVVAHYDGTQWGSEAELPVTNVRSCWLESSTMLWAAGMGQVVRWSAGTGLAQGADLTALGVYASAQQWFALTGNSGQLHVVGWSEAIMSRTAAGTWSLTLNNSTQTTPLWFRAVAPLGADEVLAAGTPPSCSACGNRVWRWAGSGWSVATSLPVIGEVRSAHAAAAGLIYFGGQVDDPHETAAIVRVSRP